MEKKYLCIDTSVFIQCCWLEIEGDDITALQVLHELLDKNEVILLLPEVIKLEFYKVLDQKKAEIEKSVSAHKEAIGKDFALNKKISDDLIASLESCIKKREVNIIEVKKEIEEIFHHDRTEFLELTPDILLASYKLFLSGKKPGKQRQLFPISADQMIIESLFSKLKEIKNYSLFLCSPNIEDFAEEAFKVKGRKKEIPLHQDIRERFCKIHYYTNLFELLNEHFEGKYSPVMIDKINVESLNPDSINEYFKSYIETFENVNQGVKDESIGISNKGSE